MLNDRLNSHRQNLAPASKPVKQSEIRRCGPKSLILDISPRRTFRQLSGTADMREAIRGADFFRIFFLLVDMERKLILDIASHLSVLKVISKATSCGPTVDHLVKRTITHRIDTTGHLVFGRPQRFAPGCLNMTR